MSGIAGIYYPDGRPVADAHLRCMSAAIAHRGQDGEGIWRRGHVGVVHRMLQSTPESQREILPLADGGDTYIVTADARIDNRAELIQALALREDPHHVLSDSDLILRAYRKWGVHCIRRLTGDFAFAIWDEREQRLFCARDRFGVKPFYYFHRARQAFLFSSEIKGLLSVPGVPRQLNEVKVGDFLSFNLDDLEITFYEHILRLPPAHTLVVKSNGAFLQRYWSLDPNRDIRFRSDAEYAEAFRELFLEAVRCRLRSAFPVGSTLSGGLDSSSIACTARELLRKEGAPRLHTFSLIFPGLQECDEREYIDAVVAEGGLAPHFVRGDELSPLQDLEQFLWHQDEPSWMFNACLEWAIYRAAQPHGVRVLLEGYGGDTTVSHGHSHLAELLRAGRWLTLGIAVLRLSRHFDASPWEILKKRAIGPFMPPAVRTAWRALRRPHPAPRLRTLLDAEFAHRSRLRQRQQGLQRDFSKVYTSTRAEHLYLLTGGAHAAAFEISDHAAAAFSIEPRYPFFDHRLVEFCLGVPAEQKLSRGWNRMILRRAMAPVLPESVLWRGGKADMSRQFNRGLLRFGRARLEEVVTTGSQAISPYVDLSALNAVYQDYAEGREDNAGTVWLPTMLALWLRQVNFPDVNLDTEGGAKPMTMSAGHSQPTATAAVGM